MDLKESKPIKDVPLDNFAQEEFRDNLLDKINFRMVFLSIILPIVLILGLVFSYLVMDYKIREKHDLTLKELGTISKDIETLETFFSEQTSESKKSLTDRISVFNRTLDRMQKDLKKQAAIAQNLKKTKTDKKAVSGIVKKELTGVVKSLDVVKNDVKKQQQTIKGLANSRNNHEKIIKDTGNNLAALANTLNDLKKVTEEQGSDIRNLSKTKADTKNLDKHYKEQQRLSDKIQFLELELRLLKKRIQSTKSATIKPIPPISSPPIKDIATKKEDIVEEEIIQ